MAVIKLLLVTPLIWIYAVLIAAAVLLRGCSHGSRMKRGWYVFLLGIGLLFFFTFPPVSRIFIHALERAYRPPGDDVLKTLDALVVLNGGIFPKSELRSLPEASGATYSRVVNGVNVFQKSSAKTLVLSGGSPDGGGEAAALVMKELAVRLGVPEEVIVTESLSQNTAEHAAYLKGSGTFPAGAVIGVVTSALHMPRAIRVFQKQFPNNPIVPISVGFLSDASPYELKDMIPSVDALSLNTAAFHELIGMVWYKVRY